MRSSRGCRRIYERRWNICLTWISHILRLGADHTTDTHWHGYHSSLYWFADSTQLGTNPLYYAALCGFQDLVEHLVVKYPQHVNTASGCYASPLVAAKQSREGIFGQQSFSVTTVQT
jgi:hypothetical protein